MSLHLARVMATLIRLQSRNSSPAGTKHSNMKDMNGLTEGRFKYVDSYRTNIAAVVAANKGNNNALVVSSCVSQRESGHDR